ncbi:MAG: ROK family protein [Candidatus Korobacteraceae bacterium]
MGDYSIGVDLGGTNLRIAAVDCDGKLLEKLELGAEVSRGRDFVITEMCKAIDILKQKYHGSGQLVGIGIGVPGFIDMAAGMVMESPNLPDWKSFPVRDEIEKRLGAPVILENDANSAAMGEKWLGAAREYDNMAMYTLGTGVGGGLVFNGLLWHGMTGMAGELGHFTVYADGHPCGCGSRGCLEQYASATAVVRMAKEAIAQGESPELERLSHDPVQFTSRSIYNLAIQGEVPAKKVFENVGRALGIGIGGMVNALNLPIYVIGGGVSSAWDAFAPAMYEEMKFRSSIYALTSPDRIGHEKGTIVTRALLGSDAGLYGAARLPMLENFSQTEKGRR